MSKKLINVVGGFGATVFALAAQAPTVQAGLAFEAFAGQYVVVSVRQNSFVASPAGASIGDADSPIGRLIRFETDGMLLDGIDCDDWQIETTPAPIDFSQDTMLSDLRLPPTSSPISDGDKRLSKFYRISCEGEAFTTVYQADNRVLALSWANSARYLILERPLSAVQIEKLQEALKSMKFYSGAVNGQFSDATERSVRAWYLYRLADPNAAIPQRPAITENLLDTLKVLN